MRVFLLPLYPAALDFLALAAVRSRPASLGLSQTPSPPGEVPFEAEGFDPGPSKSARGALIPFLLFFFAVGCCRLALLLMRGGERPFGPVMAKEQLGAAQYAGLRALKPAGWPRACF